MDANKEFANVSFEILNIDALFLILEKLDPKTVLSLCGTNSNFAKLCGDQELFKKLMRVHYPQFDIGNDPKKQYISITALQGIRYWIYISNRSDKRFPFTPGKYAKIDEDKKIRVPKWDDLQQKRKIQEKLGFEILGTKFWKTGDKIWLLICAPVGYKSNIPFVHAYRTKKDAINDIPFTKGEELINLRQRMEKFYQDFGLPDLNSEENVNEFITKNNYFGRIPADIVLDHFSIDNFNLVPNLEFIFMIHEVTLAN